MNFVRLHNEAMPVLINFDLVSSAIMTDDFHHTILVFSDSEDTCCVDESIEEIEKLISDLV